MDARDHSSIHSLDAWIISSFIRWMHGSFVQSFIGCTNHFFIYSLDAWFIHALLHWMHWSFVQSYIGCINHSVLKYATRSGFALYSSLWSQQKSLSPTTTCFSYYYNVSLPDVSRCPTACQQYVILVILLDRSGGWLSTGSPGGRSWQPIPSRLLKSVLIDSLFLWCHRAQNMPASRYCGKYYNWKMLIDFKLCIMAI